MKSDITVGTVSSSEYCFTADKTPIGIPMTEANKMVLKASVIDTGILPLILSITGSLVLYEEPKSSLKTTL
jgi:hypothetical protein